MIKATDIHKSYGALEVLRGVSLEVSRGEVVSIVGASGAGKTTLLQILGTLSKADRGSVEIDGQDVSSLGDRALSRFRNEKIGFVFQFHHLLPEFTAFENVCIPGYIGYVLVCVYGINGAKGFVQGFWQLLVILSVMNLMDRLLVDGYWVGHTNAWTIPGTEDLKPYITAKDKQKKWLFGTVGMAVIAAVLAVLMTAFIH